MSAVIYMHNFLHFIAPAKEQLIPISSSVLGAMDATYAGRLLLVLLLCGAIGLERSGHERASGFRPHILVGLGACLMTMAGAYATFPGGTERDPMRVASYVISGIGFLGAGAILRHGTTVRGITTAASLWGAAGLGVAVGVGMGWLAITATALILFTLIVLERVEYRLGRGEAANDLKLYLTDDHRAVGKALIALDRLGVPVKQATVVPAPGETAVMRVELYRPFRPEDMYTLIQRLLTIKAISRVDVAALEVEDADSLRSEGLYEQTRSQSNDDTQENREDSLQDLNQSDDDDNVILDRDKAEELISNGRTK